MDQYEQAVLNYICGRPERFVNVQFKIPYDGFRGGSCPDFVVLDFKDNTVYVVEVTAAADARGLIGRVREKATRWFDPLREHFTKLNEEFARWHYRVTLFVRDEEVEGARRAVAEFPDVSVILLKDSLFSWNWDWQRDMGLPINRLR
jgi:hypothetical protein